MPIFLPYSNAISTTFSAHSARIATCQQPTKTQHYQQEGTQEQL